MRTSWRAGALVLAVIAGLFVAAQSVPVAIFAVVLIALVARSRSKGRVPGQSGLVFTRRTWIALLVMVAAFSSRSGAAQLALPLCFAVGAIAVLDLVVAAVVTRRVSATLTADRTEVLVDDQLTITLAVTGPPVPMSVRLGPSPELAVVPATEGPLSVLPGNRGVIAALPLERRSTGVCGIVGLVRRGPVVLSSPVFVGPRPVAPDRPFPDLGGRTGDGTLVPEVTGDVVRGVREYVPGDRRTLVHWRASARAGQLVVKQVEEPFTPVLVLVLDMGYGGDEGAERAAARAAWYLTEALRRRAHLVLITWEAGGPRTGPVASTSEIIRRLAGARGGPQLSAPPPPPGHRVLRVGLDGDTWG